MINIIQQGLVVMLNYLNGFHQNKHVSTLTMQIISFLNIVVNALFFKKHEKDNPHRMIHYKNLRDNNINWECMKYPCSRKDTDRFGELNSGLIYVNLFKQFNEEERVIPDRTTKVKKCYVSIMLIYIWLKGKIINIIML